MAVPKLSWATYTLFRLIGILFVSWALVAQFIILADDMKAYNLAQSRVGVVEDIGERLSRMATHPTRTEAPEETLATAGANWTPTVGAVASRVSVFTGSASTTGLVESTGSASTGFGAREGTAEGVTVTAIDSVVTGTGMITTGEGVLRRGRKRQEGANTTSGAADEAAAELELEKEYYDGSGVPLHPGGVVFTVFSRLLFAGILGLLVCAQAGIPETMLYNHFGWLGPASTPAPLGFCQVLMATTTLSSYARDINLIPAWGLLAVGIVNLLFGGFLRYALRRLPKSPPPLLYFHYSHRLLPTTAPPEFYKQLFQKPLERQRSPDDLEAMDLSHLKEYEAQHAKSSEPDANRAGWQYAEPGRGERQVQHPCGGRVRAAKGNDQLQDQTQTGGIEFGTSLDAHQDVLRAGYPTFTGHGLADARRQVPTGVVEHGSRGEVIRFVSEEGDGVGRTGPPEHHSTRTRSPKGSSTRMDGDNGKWKTKKKREKKEKVDRTSRAKEERRARKGSPTPLSLRSSLDEGTSAMSAAHRGTFGQAPQTVHQPMPPPLHPIQSAGKVHDRADRPSSSVSMHSTRSVVHATRDLSARFPAPPPRSQTLSPAPIVMMEGRDGSKLRKPPKRSATQPSALTSLQTGSEDATTDAIDAYDGVEHLQPTHPRSSDPLGEGGIAKEPETPFTAKSSAHSPLTPHLTAMTSEARVIKLGVAQGRTVSPEPPLPALPISATLEPGCSQSLAVEVEEDPTPALQSPMSAATSHRITDTPKSSRHASFHIPRSAPPSAQDASIHRTSSLRLSGNQPSRPRASQGVRFNLSSVEEISEPSSTEPTPLSSAVLSAGLRIPGTNIAFGLPSLLSPLGGRRKRMSTGSISSEASSIGALLGPSLEKEDAQRTRSGNRNTVIIAWPGQNTIERITLDDKEDGEKEPRPLLVARKSSDELDPFQRIRPRSMMLGSGAPPSEAQERERRRSSVDL